MDYKERHGTPLVWSDEIFDHACGVDPFDKMSPTYLRQLIAPDGFSVFLMMHGYMDEANGLIVSYAIESPPICAVRKKFEVGELSWTDFWKHKGWLIRFTMQFNDPINQAEFIEPSQIDKRTLTQLEELRDTSPIQIKHRQIENELEVAYLTGRDPSSAEREYRDFLIRHGNRLTRNLAS